MPFWDRRAGYVCESPFASHIFSPGSRRR